MNNGLGTNGDRFEWNIRCIETAKKIERTVTVKEARELLIQEESSKLVNDADIHSAALRLAESSGIIFLDEIDKITSKSQQSGRSFSWRCATGYFTDRGRVTSQHEIRPFTNRPYPIHCFRCLSFVKTKWFDPWITRTLPDSCRTWWFNERRLCQDPDGAKQCFDQAVYCLVGEQRMWQSLLRWKQSKKLRKLPFKWIAIQITLAPVSTHNSRKVAELGFEASDMQMGEITIQKRTIEVNLLLLQKMKT